MYMLLHWKQRAIGKLVLVYSLPKGMGVSAVASVGLLCHYRQCSEKFEISLAKCWYYCTNWGASSLDNCNSALYNSLLLIGAVILFSILVKLRPSWFNVAWGFSDSGWALVELSVLHLCLSCFIWSVVHFSLVCFALELSILE